MELPMFDRRSAMLGLAVVSVAAPALAHPHDDLNEERRADIERQILAFRNDLKSAITAKDVAKLKEMYAESFTHVHATGKVDGRDSRIVSLLAGEPVIETASAHELSVRIHGPDMAIVSGRSPILNAQDGKSYDFRWMQVMTRVQGEWRLAASQATRLPLTS
jgi:ketosteroid isomerase-like protein